MNAAPGWSRFSVAHNPWREVVLHDREGVVILEAEADEEATLINLRYALGDALEFCRSLSVVNRPDSLAIEQLLKVATLEVMSLLKLQQANLAAAMDRARLVSSAA